MIIANITDLGQNYVSYSFSFLVVLLDMGGSVTTFTHMPHINLLVLIVNGWTPT